MSRKLNCISGDNGAKCPAIEGSSSISAGYAAYLNDESRSESKTPSRIYFPESTDQLSVAIKDATKKGGGITISGARTGIAGGAVVHSDNLVSLDHWKQVPVLLEDGNQENGGATLRCTCGTTLAEIREILADTPYRYPVDPTEMTASVGGTISTNASGARTLFYGPTRDWVESIAVVLSDGDVLEITRNQMISDDGVFELISSAGDSRTMEIRNVAVPTTKHNAGYFLEVPTDPIDLFIGSEGTLGIIAEATLKLVRTPAIKLGVTLFLAEDEPVKLVRALLELGPIALEYLDYRSLQLLANARDNNTDGGAVPPFSADARGAVYIELDLESEAAVEVAYERLEEIMADYAIDPETSWAGFDESEISEMKKFRHALPERVNTIISERKRTIPELTKIGTDMAVPLESLSEMIEFYRSRIEAAAIDYCIFGHVGNGHLHVNLMPKSINELETGRELYYEFAQRAVKYNGSVAGEHGLGRLKRAFLEIQYNQSEIALMKSVKSCLDPEGILNPGVLFEE